VFLILFGTVCGTGLLIGTIYDWLTLKLNFGLFQRALFTVISAIMTPLIIWFEFPKLKSIEINNKTIILTSLITRVKKEIAIEQIDGFKTTSKWARGGHVYEIILMINGGQFHRISSNYIKNYDKIRAELKKRLRLLSADEFEDMRSIVKEKIRD
jgi:hypothetical protein